MCLEKFLTEKLHKMTITDFAMVKWAYIILGLLAATLYHPFALLGWPVYLILAILAAMPLYMRFYSFSGSLKEKTKQYLQNNNPACQVLNLISCFSFALFLTSLLPFLLAIKWWIYLLILIALVIMPIKNVWVCDNSAK